MPECSESWLLSVTDYALGIYTVTSETEVREGQCLHTVAALVQAFRHFFLVFRPETILKLFKPCKLKWIGFHAMSERHLSMCMV